MDYIGLLLSISELNRMLHESASLDAFLDQCVKIVASHFDAHVCSIYLYDRTQNRLNLSSTVGLNVKRKSAISLKLGEGLTGLALQELRPIMVREGSKHPGYRHFPGLQEELYDAFLAVPILRGIERIGVIVVQRGSVRPFDADDQKSLLGVANQLASMIEYARLLIVSGRRKNAAETAPAECPRFVKGRSASAGWAIGRAVVDLQDRDPTALLRGERADHLTLADFDAAVVTTIDQLTAFQEQIGERLSDIASLIFAAHILFLKDEQFVGRMRRFIVEGGSPAKAVAAVADDYCAMFGKQENVYFRQKADDIRDVALRLLGNLLPRLSRNLSASGAIVVVRDLLPSDILILSAEKAAGIIVTGGGAASHVAILARSLKLPMVVADLPALLTLPSSTTILVDADSGSIYIEPGEEVRAPYEHRSRRRASLAAARATMPHEAVTVDGRKIKLLANINLISDTADAIEVRAEGIGLYRTEFPFIIRSSFPSEEEQLVVYRMLVERMPGKPITFRTLDIGGDKVLSYYADFKERNPFLGIRSIRFCLDHLDVFKQQLRAILRASVQADVGIMFPMVSSVEELTAARAVLDECKSELAAEGAVYCVNPKIGVMVELPSAVEIIESLAKRADFLSIGTNDLIQYLLAVDRTNEKVARFYCAHHPAVLRAINRVAVAANRAGIGLSVCGDMAHDPRYAEFFIGVGISTLSIDPLYFPAITDAVRSFDFSRAQEHAQRMLACDFVKEVEAVMDEAVSKRGGATPVTAAPVPGTKRHSD
jgi:phosphotransferase system, enzyme I, PtsP